MASHQFRLLPHELQNTLVQLTRQQRTCFPRKRWSHLSLPHARERGFSTIQCLREAALDSEGQDLDHAKYEDAPVTKETSNETPTPRRFRGLQTFYLKPLKRKATLGVPSCDLQLRSYSVRNLELFADFALRAAYYLRLPALGPIPLPRIVERWTVPRSNFIFKKSQENFERITLRRLVQIQDGHPDNVDLWLAFLRKHQYYGVGMKANVWTFEPLTLGKTMDEDLAKFKTTTMPKLLHGEDLSKHEAVSAQ